MGLYSKKQLPIYTAALVGCGRMGYSLGLDPKREQPASHTMALNDNPRINLIAGCDKSPTAIASWYRANSKTSVYKSSCAMYMSGKKFDVIVVAVNEDSHCIEAIDAIVSTPRLVILEKPVALDMKQAFLIKRASETHNVPVLINHERRFASDYNMALSYIKSIGHLQSIHASLCSGLCVYSKKEDRTGSYSLLHDGTHLIDIVLFFLEGIEGQSALRLQGGRIGGLLDKAMRYRGEASIYINSLLNSPTLTGVFRDENGNVRQMNAHYETSICPDVTISLSGRSRYFSFDVDIQGTEGRICIGNGYLKIYKREESSLYSGFYSLVEDKEICPPEKTGYMSNMVQNAVEFMDGKAPLRSDLRTGMNALAVIEEIKRKLNSTI